MDNTPGTKGAGQDDGICDPASSEVWPTPWTFSDSVIPFPPFVSHASLLSNKGFLTDKLSEERLHFNCLHLHGSPGLGGSWVTPSQFCSFAMQSLIYLFTQTTNTHVYWELRSRDEGQRLWPTNCLNTYRSSALTLLMTHTSGTWLIWKLF